MRLHSLLLKRGFNRPLHISHVPLQLLRLAWTEAAISTSSNVCIIYKPEYQETVHKSGLERSQLALSTTLRLLTHVPKTPESEQGHLVCCLQPSMQYARISRAMWQGREKHRHFALLCRHPSLQELQRLLVITTYALQITRLCARTTVRPAKCWESTAHFLCAVYLDLWACQQNPARGIFYTHGLHLSSSLLSLRAFRAAQEPVTGVL